MKNTEKTKNRSKSPRNTALIQICVGLLILLLSSAFFTGYSYTAAVNGQRNEHIKHLNDIVNATDRNITSWMNRCRTDLRLTAVLCAEEEEKYLAGGPAEPMMQAMRTLPQMNSGSSAMIMLLEGDRVRLCSGCGENCVYSFPFGTGEVCLSLNEAGEVFLAVLGPAAAEGFHYAELIRMKDFFALISGTELTQEYWLVLYHPVFGCFLQNYEEQPIISDITLSEAAARDDGYAVIARAEQSGQILTEDYRFLEEVGYTSNLITALPSALASNGIFNVSLAADSEHYSKIYSDLILRSILFSVLATLGASLIIARYLRSRQENLKIQTENDLLTKKNRALSEIAEKQKEIAHRQQLETIGTLTSGIAHEFNNLLTPILGRSVLALQTVDENDADLMDNLSEIYEAASKAKSLVSRISELTRKNSSVSYTCFTPDTCVEKALEISSPSFPKNVTVCTELGCPDPCLYTDEAKIGMLLLNLIINAGHAMEKTGGTLRIRTERSDAKIILTVSDTGCGIPEEIRDRIFEPFFTTKEKGHGTGLGLAIVKQIAEGCGGSVAMESEVGRGTVFTVTLPAVSDTPAKEEE